MKPGWFRIHLSTAMILMLAIAVFMWAQTLSSKGKLYSRARVATIYKIDGRTLVPKDGSSVGGFPVPFYERILLEDDTIFTNIDYLCLLVDLIYVSVATLAVAISCEWIIRQRVFG